MTRLHVILVPRDLDERVIEPRNQADAATGRVGLMYMYPRTGFARLSTWIGHASGHPVTFGLALFIVVAWMVTGPLFAFSTTWQLVINTVTTIVTFLMVFLIQNTMNRDSVAMQLKLDEIIRAIDGAHNVLLDLEECEVVELQRLRHQYQGLAREARVTVRAGGQDTGRPELSATE